MMRAGQFVLGLALLVLFAAALILWGNVEFRRHGTLFAKEIFWLFLLVGLPSGIASVALLWRWLRAA